MVVVVFEDKVSMPNDKIMAKVLGKSDRLWH
jgi:hypothetical protein